MKVLSMLAVAVAVLAAGCGSKPPAPDWQVGARGSLDRYEAAYLAGDGARPTPSSRAPGCSCRRPGRRRWWRGPNSPAARCRWPRSCSTVHRLRAIAADAGDAERAYAAYLQGEPVAADQLPAQHRAVASGRSDAATLAAMQDPLARLVAAGVVMRSGRAAPEVLQVAVDTASQQGWRRPLAAWLGAQLRLAEQAGATERGRAPAQAAGAGGRRALRDKSDRPGL
jgi:hypothetical protein